MTHASPSSEAEPHLMPLLLSVQITAMPRSLRATHSTLLWPALYESVEPTLGATEHWKCCVREASVLHNESSITPWFIWFPHIASLSDPSFVTNLSILVTGTNCNELRGATNAGGRWLYSDQVDQVHTKNNKHTPVMVIVDLIIKQYTVVTLSTNRSQPVTIVQFQTKVGAPVDRPR